MIKRYTLGTDGQLYREGSPYPVRGKYARFVLIDDYFDERERLLAEI